MTIKRPSLCCLSLAFLCLSASAQRAPSAKAPVDYANPLVGTAPLDNQKLIGNAPPPGEQLYSGFTSPGATLPHSAVNLSPINANLAVEYPAGVRASYFYPNRMIYGFSTRDGGGPTIMPMTGNFTIPPERSASVYDKPRETASPGYYSVYLDDFHTLAEMTVTTWTGIFRFTFPQSQKAHILIDLGHEGGDIEVVDDHTVRGHSQRGHYFVAEFSRPFAGFGTFRQIPPRNPGRSLIGFSDVKPAVRIISGNFAGAYLRFATTRGEQVLVKIAQGASYAEAQQRLQSEDPGWDFNVIRRQAKAAWAKKLNLIDVAGGTEKERMLFYSCLYHSFDSPRLVASSGDRFTGRDGKVHTAGYDRYGPVPFWDTGRNQIVLLTLLEPKVKIDILRSQLDMARQSGYMGTSFHGDNAVFMYLGDWERGLKFDWSSVYPYLRKNATDPNGPRHYLAEYMRQGWISDIVPPFNPDPPYAGGKAGAATTLEYSWDDHAMA
ncbi:MAG: glycoside hydrolase domain-containing protein, partial [Terracidiphilus sp.]